MIRAEGLRWQRLGAVVGCLLLRLRRIRRVKLGVSLRDIAGRRGGFLCLCRVTGFVPQRLRLVCRCRGRQLWLLNDQPFAGKQLLWALLDTVLNCLSTAESVTSTAH